MTTFSPVLSIMQAEARGAEHLCFDTHWNPACDSDCCGQWVRGAGGHTTAALQLALLPSCWESCTMAF